MKELNEIIGQDACGERLVGVIVRELEVLKDHTTVDKELDYAIELGKKLLTNNYFVEPETGLNNFDVNNTLGKMEVASLMAKYASSSLEKRNDYDEFFACLARNIEDWC